MPAAHPSAGTSGISPQRSTRAPAEGAPDDDVDYDAAVADHGGPPQQRSPSAAPAEGDADEDAGGDVTIPTAGGGRSSP